MAKRKLQRHKVAPKKKATVTPISPSGRFEVYLGKDTSTIPCLDLMDLHDGERIIRSLNLFVRGKRPTSARVESNEVLSYLRFTLGFSGVVNTASLDVYIDELSANSSILYTTKYQKYSTIKKFIEYLKENNVLPDEMKVPAGFDSSKIAKNSIKSFPELARQYVEDDSNFDGEDIKKVAEAFEIDLRDARAYSFALECIDTIHRESLSAISKLESDWDFVQSIIDKLTPEHVAFYQSVDGINDSTFFRERTAQEAIATLYAKFGTTIPATKYWPPKLESFFRSIGWDKVSSRVKRLFKGEPVEIEDAELLAFAKGLSEKQLTEYRDLEDFSYQNPRFDLRTIEHAIAILYVQRGRILPDSTQWPTAVTDYLKNRGWVPSRVRASLFPTTRSVLPFIVGLLSYIDLSPNVDTVAQYAHLGSFVPAEEKGMVRVILDKFRGKPLDKSFNADDEIIAACVRYVERVKSFLLDAGEFGREVLRMEKPPLFVQYTATASVTKAEETATLKAPHVSTVTDLVRDFISDTSVKHPILKELSNATGENFRPTNALILKLSGESSAMIQRILNHSFSSTTDLYTERVYTQTILKTKQKNFMQYLVDNATSQESKLSLDESKSENDLWDMSSDGVDEWLNCDAQRFWFHDVEIISEWVAWEKQISDYEEELKFNNPKRWSIYWLPRLAKYRSMLSLVSKAELKIAAEKAAGITLPPLS
ncbi:TPA: hypothetical protein ACGF4W_001737 [Vibrio cholerae]